MNRLTKNKLKKKFTHSQTLCQLWIVFFQGLS
jgi:hypothetical protein